MGRKLNAFEEIQAVPADFRRDQAQLQRLLLERIARQLGITTVELGGQPALPNAIQPATNIARQNEVVLTQQCTDLIEAFTRITDLQERLRCIQIVREAAGAKSEGSVR